MRMMFLLSRWEDWERDPGNDLFLDLLCLNRRPLTEMRKKRGEESGPSLKKFRVTYWWQEL